MPTVFAFDGLAFGWGEETDVLPAHGTYKWAEGHPASARRGTGTVLVGQTAVLVFVPVVDDQTLLTGRILGLYLGTSPQAVVTTQDDPDRFVLYDNGTIAVTVDDSKLAPLAVGRHQLELWDDDADAPVSSGYLTKVASIRS